MGYSMNKETKVEKADGFTLVKSPEIYSPQVFVGIMTGNCFIFKQENTIAEIENILDEYFGEGSYWSYALEEIEHIVVNKIPVVLVDVTGFYGTMNITPKYRWFEVPENFIELEKEYLG